MITIDMTIVTVAMPRIMDSLNASLDEIVWVLNAYTLAIAVLLIVSGKLGDIIGQKNTFVFGLVLFTISSALCGLSSTPLELIGARTLQGVGAAVLLPQTMAMIVAIFPAENRGAAFGIWGSVAAVGSVVGPTLGGLLVSDIGWQWIFYINVPVGVIAIIGSLLLLPPLKLGKHHKLDWLGLVLITVSLFGINFALIEGQRYNWSTVWNFISIPIIIAGSVVLLMLFLLAESKSDEPIIPLNIFKFRNFSLMSFIIAAVSFGLIGLFIPFMVFLQSVLGYSALKAGLVLVPGPATAMIIAPISGRLTDRIDPRPIVGLGLLGFASGLWLFTHTASLSSTWSSMILPLVLIGAGMGLTFAPVTTLAMRDVEGGMAGAASSVFNTIRQFGVVLGAAIVGAVLQSQLASNLPTEAKLYSASLPIEVRPYFIRAFLKIASSGFKIGPAKTQV